jgi:pilus assembly protein CpaD
MSANINRMERAGRLMLIAAAVLGLAAVQSGCRRLEDYEAAELSNPEKRHPIAYSSVSETLYVEVGPGSAGLSPNQEADVYRFVERFKAESTGTLRLGSPRRAGAHLAVSNSARQVQDIVHGAGVAPSALEIVRYAGEPRMGPALQLSYDRPVAVAPECADWGTDLGENRERLPFNNFGCATQRNMALTVANARDLQHPQAETPRSSEVRSTSWTKYTSGGAQSSAESTAGTGAGTAADAVSKSTAP